jgi:hypothetical protein
MHLDFAKQAFDRGYEDTLVALGLSSIKQADLQKEAIPFLGALASKGMGLLGKGVKAVGGMFGNKGVQQAGQQAAKPTGMMGKAWGALTSTPAQVAMLGASSIPTN